jgi:hypothetical protein
MLGDFPFGGGEWSRAAEVPFESARTHIDREVAL